MEDYIKTFESKANFTLENLREEFSLVRAFGAHPEILNHIVVDFYGEKTNLKQIAGIKQLDAQNLSVTPFDKESKFEISKAISADKVKFSLVDMGDSLKISFPLLTTESRKEMVKKIKQLTEHARISVRNIRHDILNKTKRNENFSEDQVNNLKITLQEKVSKINIEIDNLFAQKERDLLSV